MSRLVDPVPYSRRQAIINRVALAIIAVTLIGCAIGIALTR